MVSGSPLLRAARAVWGLVVSVRLAEESRAAQRLSGGEEGIMAQGRYGSGETSVDAMSKSMLAKLSADDCVSNL